MASGDEPPVLGGGIPAPDDERPVLGDAVSAPVDGVPAPGVMASPFLVVAPQPLVIQLQTLVIVLQSLLKALQLKAMPCPPPGGCPLQHALDFHTWALQLNGNGLLCLVFAVLWHAHGHDCKRLSILLGNPILLGRCCQGYSG